MPFEQGISGNPKGRPKGGANKSTAALRQMIGNFLENNFEEVVRVFEQLAPKDRIKVYCELLQYGVPRLQAVQLETEFDNLPESQLDQIIHELKNVANGNEPEG